VVYYIVEEGIEIRKLKLAYFKNIYNCMDLAVIAVSIVTARQVALLIGGILSLKNNCSNENAAIIF